ncbi:MAG: DEAD-box ATP-dependent RNA helicase DeaD (CshA) [uncultured Thermomicrobiales bacterium]|uniref:DEAD-box ATP-dependent RNA helicase RhpA n=1 Tax=uncultured Thermomicrobiales bacterium TaxID=1645740 RepID=A0A6J4U962_9BACT|nr:MAG: DEAD-box ATP-dependent RNA helicase DeaD (CshA) [uncultured Thermomicrobiales bacterium]
MATLAFSHRLLPFFLGRSGPMLFAESGGAALLDRPDPETDPVEAPVTLASNEAPKSDSGTTFADLGLSDLLLQSIAEVGYEVPSPIQEQTIPVLLAGRDVIAQAQTGSGKTAAFGLPIIETIEPRERGVQTLILCPTRELAIQVSEALHKYGRHKRIETLPIYGGQPYERQLRGLQRGVHIVVGTPGRVMDHMRRGTLRLDSLKFFVLDEADEMLDMGFVDDIEWILQQVPAERQTALFSATMPPRIAELARQYMKDPQRISVRGKEMTVPETHQVYYEVPRARKVDALTRILDAEVPSSAMIFCRTKHGVDELGEALMARGFPVETLHGDLSQSQRDRVMKRFRSGQAEFLIATDVAARGLDVPDVSHVINFDIPESPETYVHRIGRTGRAGKAGTAITLVMPRESRWIRTIERITKARIEPRRLPSASDVNERRREVLKSLVEDVLKDEESFSGYMQPVRELSEDHDPLDIAAALLKLYATETGRSTTETQSDNDIATFVGAPSSDGGRANTNMVRLSINIGRNVQVRPQDIVGAIANEANIPGRAIGAIDIFDTYTYVDVPADAVSRVISVMNNSAIKGRPVTVEATDEPAASGPRSGGSGRGPRPGGGGGFRGPRRDDRPARPGGFRPERSGGFGARRDEEGRGRRAPGRGRY